MKRSFHRWTTHDKKILEENYEHYTRSELAEKIGVTENSVKRKAYDLGLTKSEEALSKIYKRPNAGQYQKGCDPINLKYDKAITYRLDNRGKLYKWIRLSKNQWQMLHVYLWEKAGNTIPEGFVLKFKDNNPLNCVLQNLEVIDRRQLLTLNKTIARNEEKMNDKRKRRAAKAQSKKLRDRIMNVQKPKVKAPEKSVKPNGTYKTRDINLSALISVRINRKTVIFVKPGTDIEKIKRQYA